MSIIGVPNLKEIEAQKVVLMWFKYVKGQISQEMLKGFPSILICEIVYM